MAIGEKERKLLTNFWESNEKLIMATLYAISSDPKQEKDVRDKISETLQSISSSGGKDKSSIIIKYKDQEYIIDKKADIGSKTVDILLKNNLINNESIKILENDTSCGFILIKERKDITESEIEYTRYPLNKPPELVYNNREYYIVRNWGIGNIDKFIDNMTINFPGLRYEILKENKGTAYNQAVEFLYLEK